MTTANHAASQESMAQLTAQLGRFSVLTDVAHGLGIADPSTQSEEFWTEQRRAARQRTFMLAQQRLGEDILAERNELGSAHLQQVCDEIDRMLAENLTYADVRQWFLMRGQFEQNKALAHRREQRILAEKGLRVMLLPEEGGAKYLAYGASPQEALLVSSAAQAHVFPVHSISELTPAYLAEMARHFEAVRIKFNAKQIKVLVGSRN